MDKKNATRRDLLRGGVRLATLGAIVAGVGGAAVKRRRLLREGKCVGKSICVSCKVFDICGLPRAQSVRQARGQAHG